jgi:hypothetical protein
MRGVNGRKIILWYRSRCQTMRNNEQKVKKSSWGLCTVLILISIKLLLTLIRFVPSRSR